MTEALRTTGGIPVAVRRSTRARRMRLSVDAHGVATVVLPKRATLKQAGAFVHAQSAWLERHARRGLQATAAIEQQVRLDVFGRPTRIPLRGEWIDVVWGAGSKLRLPANGTPEQLGTRLRNLARTEAEALVDQQTHLLAGAPRQLTIRDQSTRWGSLSGRGTLSLNWRLIMAPPAVFAYVVNHELAHLRHPDHSPAFWAEVERLMPGHAAHRRWLRREGDGLRRVLPVPAS